MDNTFESMVKLLLHRFLMRLHYFRWAHFILYANELLSSFVFSTVCIISCSVSYFRTETNSKCVSIHTFLCEAEQLKTDDESEILNIKSRESIERELGDVTSI